jgi:ABC-type maltose transport system permease subunit
VDITSNYSVVHFVHTDAQHIILHACQLEEINHEFYVVDNVGFNDLKKLENVICVALVFARLCIIEIGSATYSFSRYKASV